MPGLRFKTTSLGPQVCYSKPQRDAVWLGHLEEVPKAATPPCLPPYIEILTPSLQGHLLKWLLAWGPPPILPNAIYLLQYAWPWTGQWSGGEEDCKTLVSIASPRSCPGSVGWSRWTSWGWWPGGKDIAQLVKTSVSEHWRVGAGDWGRPRASTWWEMGSGSGWGQKV